MRMRSSVFGSKLRLFSGGFALLMAGAFGLAMAGSVPATASAQAAASYTPAARGELDCNGFSPVQQALRASECADIRGDLGVDDSNTWGGRFYDNGHYIGHDEPDATFQSTAPGSGGNVTWTVTLGRDLRLRGTGQLRLHPDERSADRTARAAECRPEYRDAEPIDTAHGPWRHNPDSHVRRACSGRQSGLHSGH